MNVKLLRRIQKQILAEPRQFQMRYWFSDELPQRQKIPNCGTAACIAGHAVAIIKGLNPAHARKALITGFTNADEVAEPELGITTNQAQSLFLFSHWPKQFRKHEREGTPAFARQAVRRINFFIKTKGTDRL